MVTKRSARRDRTATINQMRAMVLSGPDDLRTRFAHHTTVSLINEAAVMRPRAGDVVGYTTRIALRELGRRAMYLTEEIDRLKELMVPLVAHSFSALLAIPGIGPDTAALLLIAAGDRPERLRSEAVWAHLCGTAPIPASSGKITRRRLNPAGDRQANHALWRIVITRMSSDPRPASTSNGASSRGKRRPRSSAA
jgi:transposase